MKGTILLTIGSGLATAFLMGGCGGRENHGPKPELPTITVQVHQVESKARVATEDVVGTVRARLRSVIEAKVTGKVESLVVVPGHPVRAGDILATIEAREIQARLDQAQAVRQQAEADLKRYASLLEQKILAQSEYDNAQAKFRVAQGAVSEAETLLGYTKVVAPFDGVITRKHVDVGDLAAPGKPLLEMEDPRALRLEADVPEAAISRLALGDRLPVWISSIERSLEGQVSEIAPAADPGSRTFLVKCDLPASASLRTGQFGRVSIPVGETLALRVPVSAVVQRGQMELVFVLSNSHAHLRIVKTGKRVGNEVEIVSGLSAGESVVVDDAAGLSDGQPLTIKP
jgi:membrane fusion protein, multidrug efflux system